MDHLGIQAFIAVAQVGNISRAAEQLYATPSAVGKRIIQLEQEIGTQLLIRGKGKKDIRLTNAGEALIPMATRWLALWSEMRRIDEAGFSQSLGIGIIESITPPLFVPLFRLLYKDVPWLRLRIISKPSLEMYAEVESRRVDIGFTLREVKNPHVVAARLFSEPFVVLRPAKGQGLRPEYAKSMTFPAVSLDALDVEHELFIAWQANYELWHDHHQSRRGPRNITFNNAVLLVELLIESHQWAIVPLSVACEACRRKPFDIYALEDPPPPRVCYTLTHREPKESSIKSLEIFSRYLDTALVKNIPWAEK